jgi:hypothetical protein
VVDRIPAFVVSAVVPESAIELFIRISEIHYKEWGNCAE